jgi:hemerythrin
VVEWLDMHYGEEDREKMKQIKTRFQQHDPAADMGL